MAHVYLKMTLEEFETIRNMVEFSSWHASDGMSPALSDNFIENIENAIEREARYQEQMSLVKAARAVLHLNPEIGGSI